jgi:predicted phosphodiesterase
MNKLGTVEGTMLLFGGPYSNYAATAAMRQRARELGIPPERTVCNGDVIAYCGEPGETLDLIREWGIHLVMGNCEESLAFGEADCGCGFDPGSECSLLAVTWYDYANRLVSADQRRWMRALPRYIDFSMSGVDLRIVHGSLGSINEFVFASSEQHGRLEQIRDAGIDVVIGGHSGIPFGQCMQERYWLNTGVIGMPANDGGSHGWYLLLEPGADAIEASWHRLDYDSEVSRASTVAAGMSAYGQALVDGLWPNVDILPEAERRQSGQPLDLPPLRIQPPNPLRRARNDLASVTAGSEGDRKTA